MEEVLNSTSNLSWDVFISKMIDLGISLGSKLLIALVILIIGRWIVKRLRRQICTIMEKRQVEASLFSFVKSLVSITLNFVLIITIISVLGIETSSFIALFASAGVAIGMALSGTLQNFAGGVMILLFKPFKVGDSIEAQGQSGKVKEIQIFNTLITTPDNKILSGLATLCPNEQTDTPHNKKRRIKLIFTILISNLCML